MKPTFQTRFLAICLIIVETLSSSCSLSHLDGIATGLVEIKPAMPTPQTSTYSIPLSSFTLGTNVRLFPAFALAGFQTPTQQYFYNFVVQTVTFSNDNKLMQFSLNFGYYSNGTLFITTWKSIRLSWMVVSSLFETVVNGDAIGGSYIWAGSGEIYPNGDVSGAVMDNSTFIPQTAEMMDSAACGFVDNSTGFFDLYCNGQQNSRFLTHSYIMGFQYAQEDNYTLAAGVAQGSGNTLADWDEALTVSNFAFVDETTNPNTPLSLTGPIVLVEGFGGNVKYMKIAFVITVILDINDYPITNTAAFLYSGVYMKYETFNSPHDLVQPYNTFAARVDGSQNYNFFTLPNAKYQIFGLSSFMFNSSLAVGAYFDFNVFMVGTTSVILQTDDGQGLSNVKISADRWNNLITCDWKVNPIVTADIIQQILKTVPESPSSQQQIVSLLANGTISQQFSYQFTAASIGNISAPLSKTVVFITTLIFDNFTAGLNSKISFKLENTNNYMTGYSNDTNEINFSLETGGKQIFKKTKIPSNYTIDINDVWTVTTTYIFTTFAPTVVFTLTVPRDPINWLTFTSTLSITQYINTYDPSSDCCVQGCPTGINFQYSLIQCGTCPLGLVFNPETLGCTGCPLGCLSCTQYICDSCISEYYLSFSYDSLYRCVQCPSPCLTCTNSTNCTSCISGYNYTNNSCEAIPSSEKSLNYGAVIPPLVAIVLLVIIAVVSKNISPSNENQEDIVIDTIESRQAINAGKSESIQWKSVNSTTQNSLKTAPYCSVCHSSPGNALMPCGHIYHMSCAGPWFANHQTCVTCTSPSTSSASVTIICLRCRQSSFSKPFSELLTLDPSQISTCSQCYKQQLREELKIQSQATL